MPRFLDLSGQRFGRLVVRERAPNAGRRTAWLCDCDCGCRSTARAADLRSGRHASCGCLHRDRLTKHGHSGFHVPASPTYRSWVSMIQRCTNPKAISYDRYGGRGIKVARRWRAFVNFLADMGERPAGMTLDRFPDPDGNYEPGNCRWATRKQQANNRTGNRRLTHAGRTMTVAEWADHLRVPVDQIRGRLKLGWPVADVLERPPGYVMAFRGPTHIDMTGKAFGRLTVLRYSHTKASRAFWVCRCECGAEKAVCGKDLRAGAITSCGCFRGRPGVSRR